MRPQPEIVVARRRVLAGAPAHRGAGAGDRAAAVRRRRRQRHGGGGRRRPAGRLRRDHPEAVAPLADLEAGAGEIAAALATVLRLGGFLPAGAASGEAGADQPPASTGPRSTPA